MRAYVPGYDLRVPGSLSEALALLAREPGVWQPFAGGTDLMVLLEAGTLSHKRFLSVSKLADLRGIEVNDDEVILGALTTYTEIQKHLVLQAEFPLLCSAARETGSIATQNRGTIGGNIANASPAADSPPALLVYDAELELISERGAHWAAYHGFHTGYKKMKIAADELLRAVRLPRAQKAVAAVLPKSGHAQGPGNFESVFRGRRSAGRRYDWRSAHCARKRRAAGAACGENGGCAARRAPHADRYRHGAGNIGEGNLAH